MYAKTMKVVRQTSNCNMTFITTISLFHSPCISWQTK